MPVANERITIRHGKTSSYAVPEARPGTLARAVRPSDKLNKTERRYRDRLESLKLRGEIHDYRVHPFGLRLGEATFYHIDFLVVEADWTQTLVEVKGFERDDAIVKFKAAAAMFPWWRFVMVKYDAKRNEWVETRRLNA